MSDKTPKTIRIKWVRSGIGFSHYQKTIIRSLGLKRLNQVVVRPDTPQTRGIVGAVPHLLRIISDPAPPAGAAIPEYSIAAPPLESPSPLAPAAATAGTEAGPEVEAAPSAPAGEAAPGEVASDPPKGAEKGRKIPAAENSEAGRGERAETPASAEEIPRKPMPTRIGRLRPPAGAHHRAKRIGQGMGSGHGKTATRGSKGQRSRTGMRMRPGFEGGQMPLHRRLPKRGFTNIFAKDYAVVNLGSLGAFAPGEKITPESLVARGLIKSLGDGLKVLGGGELKAPLEISAHSFSKAAREKIEKAGGKAEVIS